MTDVVDPAEDHRLAVDRSARLLLACDPAAECGAAELADANRRRWAARPGCRTRTG